MDAEETESTDPLAELADAQELPGILAGLEDPLAGENKELQLAVKEVSTTFLEDPEVRTIREDIPGRLYAAFREHDRVVVEGEVAVKDGMMGPKQLEELRVKAAEDLAAAVVRERGHLAKIDAKFSERYGVRPLPQPSPETLAEISAGFAGFDVKTGRRLLSEAENDFRLLKSDGLSPKERARILVLVEHKHLPIAQRMASSPPRHSRHLVPAFQSLQKTIEMHLDIARRGPESRLAGASMRDALQQFDFAVREAEADGWGDGLVIRTGSPLYSWPEEK